MTYLGKPAAEVWLITHTQAAAATAETPSAGEKEEHKPPGELCWLLYSCEVKAWWEVGVETSLQKLPPCTYTV